MHVLNSTWRVDVRDLNSACLKIIHGPPSIIARGKSLCVVGPLLVAGLTLAAASDAGAGVMAGWGRT